MHYIEKNSFNLTTEWSATTSGKEVLINESRTTTSVKDKTQPDDKIYNCSHSQGQPNGVSTKKNIVAFIIFATCVYVFQMDETSAIFYSLVEICRNLVSLARRLLDLPKLILLGTSVAASSCSIKAIALKLFNISLDAILWEYLIKPTLSFLLKFLKYFFKGLKRLHGFTKIK